MAQRTVLLCKVAAGLTIVGVPPAGSLNAAYNFTFSAKGGTGAYTWAISSGTLPTGTSFTDNGNGTATISGLPSVAGTYTFTVYVRNTNGWAVFGTYSITVPAVNGFLTQTVRLYRGVAVTAGQLVVNGSGGKAPYTYAIVSGGPAGLTMSSAGVFSGTPTTIATYTTTISVTDANAAVQNVVVTIIINSRLVNISPAQPLKERFTNFSWQQSVSGATGTVTWSIVSGGFPSGIGFNTTTGLISGSFLTTTGSSATIRATDSGTGDTLTYSVGFSGIAGLISVTPSTQGPSQKLVNGVPTQFTVNCGAGWAPYTAYFAGAADPNVSISGRVLTINPTGLTPGTYTDSMGIQDAAGQTAPFTLVYTVVDPNGSIQPQQNASNLGTISDRGPTTWNFSGSAWNNSNSAGLHTIQLNLATGSQDGYLSQTDWNAFNGKQASSAELTGLAAISGTGFVKRTGAGTYTTVASAGGLAQQTLTSSTTIASNTENFVNANTLTTTGPAAPVAGDQLSFTFAASVTAFSFAPNGLKIETTSGTMVWNVIKGDGNLAPFTIVYSNATDGWKFK